MRIAICAGSLVCACVWAIGADLADLASQAQFVFEATVEKLDASTITELPVQRGSIIVRVRKLYRCPPAFQGIEGNPITVFLQKPGNAAVGQNILFFAGGAMYGDSLAVREFGRAEIESPNKVAQEISMAFRISDDRAISRRLAQAELVLIGSVYETGPMAKGKSSDSEHDPKWWFAKLRVSEFLKGKADSRDITIMFPQSDDVMWASSPKFTKGQQGVWILRHENIRALPETKRNLTALKRGDFYPTQEVDRLRKLTD